MLGVILKTDFLVIDTHLTLRPVRAGDEDALYRIYASTRLDELALVDWTAEQKEIFLHMQFQAQTKHYQIYYPNAEYQMIQHEDNGPIGRLIVDRSKQSIQLMDIALFPEYRNTGIGTALIKDLITEATEQNRPITLHVEIFNRAMQLYNRLGFVKIGEQGIYHEMVWRPGNILS
jgi:ribosomal protein S18 acetylase RimI-like enzyme